MPSRQEVIEKLQGFIDASEPLKTQHHTSLEWALWKDEVHMYLRRVLGQQAAADFHNKLIVPFIGPVDLQPYYVRALDAAVTCLHIEKARVERGEYDGAPSDDAPQRSAPPSVFIAHSGEPNALHRLTRFLEALGVKPVIAEWLPFRGRQVPDHARSSMDGCDAAIVFATVSDAVGQRQQPGPGALIETGILQERFGDRVIYLVEKGAHFGPMADGFAHESFTRNCLEKAFHRIVVELRAHKVI